MKRRFKPCEPGDVFGGVEILEILVDAALAQDTIYRGKYLCCGALVDIDHRALSQRARNNHMRCIPCRKARRPVVRSQEEVRVPRKYSNDTEDETPQRRDGREPTPGIPSASEIWALYERAAQAVRRRYE